MYKYIYTHNLGLLPKLRLERSACPALGTLGFADLIELICYYEHQPTALLSVFSLSFSFFGLDWLLVSETWKLENSNIFI